MDSIGYADALRATGSTALSSNRCATLEVTDHSDPDDRGIGGVQECNQLPDGHLYPADLVGIVDPPTMREFFADEGVGARLIERVS